MLDKGLVPDDNTYDTLVNGKFQGTRIWLFCLWHAFLHSCILFPSTGWGNKNAFQPHASDVGWVLNRWHAVWFGQVGDDGFYWCTSQRCWGAGVDLLKQLQHVLSGRDLCWFLFINWYLWSERNNGLHFFSPLWWLLWCDRFHDRHSSSSHIASSNFHRRLLTFSALIWMQCLFGVERCWSSG